TVGSSNNIEVGLRAKQRFPAANIFNYDGNQTYNFTVGESSPGSGRPLWNFEWSVNVDLSGTSGNNLNDFAYNLKLDGDPSVGTSFTSFDPINVFVADHALGDNNTGNGEGATYKNDPLGYHFALGTENVAQNSWAMHWFVAGFDPNVPGTYRLEFEVLSLNQELLASTGIDVVVSAIPLPAALPLYGAGIAILGFLGWRRKRA
ncbi:MAG: hypothetical protein MI743_05055, partial [Sneathiellales bacterium]|nr:hypothetical protein [Sneathiellales bacterium]